MIKGSDSLDKFMGYAFAKLNQARDEAAKTREIIDMGVGDPEFATSDTIQKAMIDSLAEDGIFGYPSYNGETYFRQSAARYMKERFGVDLCPDNEITVLIGSKEGIFNISRAMLNPGDIGAYTSPGYPVYQSSIALAYSTPFELPLLMENNFLPNLVDIPENTKLAFINYPNNPTGAVANADFFRQAVNHARDNDYLLINDAAYIDVYDSEVQPSILQLAGDDRENVLEVHSLSKGFAMTGWRVAFAAGSPTAIKYLGALKKQIDSGVFMPIQKAAAFALDNHKMSRQVCEIYFDRKRRFTKALEESQLFDEIFKTDATFYIWAKVKSGVTSEEFAGKMLRELGIVSLPGSYLGEHGEGFVRFSMTISDDDIDKAIARLR